MFEFDRSMVVHVTGFPLSGSRIYSLSFGGGSQAGVSLYLSLVIYSVNGRHASRFIRLFSPSSPLLIWPSSGKQNIVLSTVLLHMKVAV